MAIPSLKTINDFFPYMATETQKLLHQAMRHGASLQVIDQLLEHFGIEYIRDNRGDVVAKYSNSGDTYAPTVFVVNGIMRITTLGDFVETWERAKRRKLA